MQITHGEGKVVTRNDQALQKLKTDGCIVFKYVYRKGKEGPYPINPNIFRVGFACP